MKTTSWMVGWTVLLCGCARGDAPIEPIALGAPAGPVTLVREAGGSEGGGYDLFLPARPIPLGGAVWVLERGNDQIVRFDSTLTRARAFGRSGEGPGEIEFAQDLVLDGDRLIVAETGNARLSFFDTTGAFRSTLRLSTAPAAVALSSGSLVALLASGEEYAWSVDERGALAPLGAVPAAVRRLARSDPALYLPASPELAATGGAVYVLDQSVLTISEFDRDGKLVDVRTLPEPFRRTLLERRVAQREAWGARAEAFVSTPAAKRLAVDREGRLLVLLPLPDTWGLLVDPRSWTARPLATPADRRLADILTSASDAALDGPRLFVVSGQQLYQLAAEGW